MIERVRRTTYDWYGLAKHAPGAGAFLCCDKGVVWYVASARRVKVRVSRGETARFVFELLKWNPDDVPEGSTLYPIHWGTRK